jgi:molybdenum cofactor cytidylyltransferase
MTNIPVLLLAAGSSKRMGQPKQLLPWGNITLIENQIRTLIKTGNPVNVVLGSDSNLIIPLIETYPVTIFINNEWERGMGSSISFGIAQITQKYPKADGVLICLLDQPLITTSHLKKMLDNFHHGSQQILVSRSVSGWTGVPVLFDQCYFNDLSKLRNDEGAKKIIQQHEEKVIILDGGEIMEDIDSPESYKELLNKYIGQEGITPTT